ncbi:MAG: hypothetical protein HWN68_09380 [Desulfobacterales bacterium]|nr:hypothetical protein [Desulfobacterales bacterium]
MAMVYLLVPETVWAGGKKAKLLVHVCDTRGLSGIYLYFGNMYNENLLMFGIWTVVILTALGSGFGFFMDIIMARTGLDLTSRELHE